MARCITCCSAFELVPGEAEFLEKMDLPNPPRNCPDCRRQRRLAFRNERRLYHRECDNSGKRVVALYPQESTRNVVMYEQSSWWDYQKMDPLSYGREFDFSRPFFDQLLELRREVPHPNLHNTNVQNAMYGNHCVSNKNCYLTIGSDLCEECYYTYWAIRCRDCIDCSVAYDSELCYSCSDIRLCYNCNRVDNSENIIDSQYCTDCKSCHDCFCCVGLRHKEYHLLNEPLSREEYRVRLQGLLNNPQQLEMVLHRYQLLCRSSIHLSTKNLQSENVLGDRLWRSHECYDSFDLEKCEFVNHSMFGFEGLTCKDVDFFGRSEKCYDSFSAFGQNNCIATILCHFSFDTFYSEYCISCHHLFGCSGLHHHKYCVLNKEYAPKDWQDLTHEIIAHMKKTEEWGEFFPLAHSFFPYNATVAQKYYPLTRNQILERGLTYDAQILEGSPDSGSKLVTLPEDHTLVDETICEKVLRCEKTGRPYRIMPKEYHFLRERNLALPRLHQDERNEERMGRRNPSQLWIGSCATCGVEVPTTFDPARGFRINCEQCYGQRMY